MKKSKHEIVSEIKQRIIDEHRKHKTIAWEEVAARKIYASFLSDPIVNIKKEELFDVLVIALKHGFNSYEENESGLKAFNAEVEAEWLINKYL